MAPWIICALCAFIILKPNEFIPALTGLPTVYVLFGIGVVFTIVDIIWKRTKPALAPQVPYVVAFFAWALLTTAVKKPAVLDEQAMPLVIVLVVFLLAAVGLGSSFGVRLFAILWLGCALSVSVVATMQGFAPLGCMIAAPDDWEGKGELEYTGRPCETALDCRKDAPDPDANFRCEHVGPWKTSSVGGRVRYRGSLADPNELTLMTAMAIPLAFALLGGRKRKLLEPSSLDPKTARRPALPLLVSDALITKITSAFRAIPQSAVLALIGLVTVLSKSRGGLLVYLIVVGIQFIRKLGAWGVVAGCVVGPPMLLLGGRHGVEAEESADERTDLIREGFQMIRHTKGIGLGVGQFADESSIGLTAHNAYLLAAAEAGIIGLFLFGLAVYASVKVPYALWFGQYDVDPWLQRAAPAIAIAITGAIVGIVFLSWSYKDVLYMMLAGSAALYAAARRQDPRFRVRITPTEILGICTGLLGFVFALYVAARFKG